MAASMDWHETVNDDDYYAWLGLNCEASKDEICNAFRRLSRIYHPDKHIGNPEMKEKAEIIFAKIKKAYDVLSDPQRKAIYDTMGIKGLETEGWELVPKLRSPQHIINEYERLTREREERRLQQKTNPKGSVTVGIDATDFFDRYEAADAEEYRSLPQLEISNMTIAQSVEAPITLRDTVCLAGTLTTQNGTGQGTIGCSYRKVTSNSGWAEVEFGAGNGQIVHLRGYRTLWKRSHVTMTGTMQVTPNGLKPSLHTSLGQQFDKYLHGRMVLNMAHHSSVQNMLVWDRDPVHCALVLQLGMPATFVAFHYTHKLPDQEAKIRGSIKAGTTFGVLFEYGAEKKISQFSILGGSMVIGPAIGVTLKIKLNRGNQTYTFPIHLSDGVSPNVIFYGTVIPLAVIYLIKKFFVNPFMQDQFERNLQKQKEAYAEKIANKRREATDALELMKETVDRSYEIEGNKGGLCIRKAVFGKLQGDDMMETECISVARQLQALVKDSKLFLPEGTNLSELPGFYDPCYGETKDIVITYEFRKKLHQVKYQEREKILIPNIEHVLAKKSILHPQQKKRL